MNASTALTAAALTGMLLGIQGCSKQTPASSEPAAARGSEPSLRGNGAAPTEAASKHACKGQNACKGQGGCKVEGKHACKGHNDCKGQGGCAG